MHLLTATIILSFVALAQDAPDPEIVRAAKSPYDLARYIDSHPKIDDWKPLWTAMGNAGEPPKQLPRCAPYPVGIFCSTELIPVLNPSQVIVLLRTDSPGYDVYLRFFEQEGGWKFAGYYVAEVLPRRHEVFRFGDKYFLAIAERGVRASDFTLELEHWFDLAQPTLEPVFSFPVQASFNAWVFGIGRQMQGTAVQSRISTVETINLNLRVQFYFDASNLGSKSFGATYERQPGETKFTIRSASSPAFSRSTISITAFEEIENIVNGPSTEQMLVYALPGLKELAGKDTGAKDALKGLIEKCKDTPEKRALLELLAKP
jgi:hypothetical protein